MSNFDFVKAVDWPEIYSDCARAESYALTDPRSACIYSRRAVEHLLTICMTSWRFRSRTRMICRRGLMMPHFKVKIGAGIATKLNLIRKCGNHAVHDQKPIPARAALDALRELHHVMVWAAFHHSANPQAVPLKAVFDPALAVKSAPVPREEVAKLVAQFQAQDEVRARALAEKDELAAAKDAEIAELRKQIKQAQAASQKVDDRDYSEAETRDRFIDVLAGRSGLAALRGAGP